MNGAFRHEPLPVFGDRLANIRSWWQRCAEVQAEGFLVTSWEAYRLALETTTVVDAAAASLWLQPEAADDAVSMLADGLKRVFPGQAARSLARLLLAADENAFCGYARWQINQRWDTFAGNESLKPYAAEWRFFQRLAKQKLPPAIAASMVFRIYLAARDVFVRKTARDVFKLRRLLAKDGTKLRSSKTARPEAGLHLKQMQAEAVAFSRELRNGWKAARAMWTRTRDPRAHGQNEAILDADEQRLAAWRDWLKRARTEPQIIFAPTPVCGAWQLQFWVYNFAPAAQKVVVERLQPDNTWRELASRYTIEFRAKAARPLAKIRREFTVPVDSPEAPLRVAVHGVGQVAISHLALTNGMDTRRAIDWSQRKIIGRPVSPRGLPELDGLTEAQLLDVTFPVENL